MCTFKSGIILKDRVFVPDYESHTDMLNELGIKDTQKNAERLFVRAELIPPGHDPFTDIDTWQLKVDQDIIPDWFVKEYEEKRMRAAVMEYAKGHIHIGVKGLVLDRGNHYIKDCEDVTAMGSSTVTAMDSSTVTAMDSSTVTAWGSSTVTAWGSSTVTAPLWSSVPCENIVLANNSTFKDCRIQKIFQCGDWEIVSVMPNSDEPAPLPKMS